MAGVQTHDTGPEVLLERGWEEYDQEDKLGVHVILCGCFGKYTITVIICVVCAGLAAAKAFLFVVFSLRKSGHNIFLLRDITCRSFF